MILMLFNIVNFLHLTAVTRTKLWNLAFGTRIWIFRERSGRIFMLRSRIETLQVRIKESLALTITRKKLRHSHITFLYYLYKKEKPGLIKTR